MIIFIFDSKEECDKFTALYQDYRKLVLYTIRLFIKDSFVVEDLLQDIYILIGKNLAKINMADPVRSKNYIITIARNYCISYLRKQSKINEDFIDDMSVLQYEQDDILKEVVIKEQFEQLMEDINKLEDIYRVVMELKYIDNLSDDEIAIFLNIKKKTVQMRLYRAKIILRNKLEGNV